jgi:hypothetical protein
LNLIGALLLFLWWRVGRGRLGRRRNLGLLLLLGQGAGRQAHSQEGEQNEQEIGRPTTAAIGWVRNSRFLRKQ